MNEADKQNLDRQNLDRRNNAAASTQRNRWLAASIMLLPVAVVLCASALWWAVQRGYIDIVGALGTHNNGQLITPIRDIEQYPLRRLDGSAYHYRDQEQKWSLVIVGDASCADDRCQERLWLTRQLHTALGRRAQYLRRLYLSSEWPLEDKLLDTLSSEHPQLTVLQATAPDLDALAGSGSDASASGSPAAFYLADKQGYLMMFYTDQNTGRDVIADLKFLMKQSGDE